MLPINTVAAFPNTRLLSTYPKVYTPDIEGIRGAHESADVGDRD
jgi:hypothetical protein